MADIRTRYAELKKKYALPEYDQLDADFRISDIDSQSFLLSRICEHINERIQDLLKIIEPILEPDTILTNIYEYKQFNDDERERVYRVFKKLMRYNRHALQLSLGEDEDNCSRFITCFSEEYGALRKEMTRITELLKQSWDQETSIKEDLSYLG